MKEVMYKFMEIVIVMWIVLTAVLIGLSPFILAGYVLWRSL